MHTIVDGHSVAEGFLTIAAQRFMTIFLLFG